MLSNFRFLLSKAKTSQSLYFSGQRYFSEDISSSFKSRSKLTEFYKYTHPDILSNAPEKIKEENLRSIKNLNAYLDAINQNAGAVEQTLKFYIAEKSTNKNKKFYFFEVTLPPLKPGSSQEILEKHNHNVTQQLLKNLKETRVRTNPLLRTEAMKDSMKKSKSIFDDVEMAFDSSTMEPMKKKANVGEEYMKRLSRQSYVQANIDLSDSLRAQQELRSRIEDEVFIKTGSTKEAGMFTRMIAYDDSKFYKELNEYLINPRLIYFSEKISDDQATDFLNRVVMDKKASQQAFQSISQLQQLSYQLSANDPMIFLLVSEGYSFEEIPGFISIPVDFKEDELIDYVAEHLLDAANERETFLENKKKAEDLCTTIKNHSFFHHVQINEAKMSTVKKMDSVVLCLKRLQKLFMNNYNPSGFKYIFQNYTLQIDDNFRLQKYVAQVPVNYKEKNLFEFLKSLKCCCISCALNE